VSAGASGVDAPGAAAPVVVGLYVPGDRPDRFEKAATSGAEMIILDLEDAVAPDHKDEAREAVLGWLQARVAADAEQQGALSVVQVRVNSGARGDDDVRALAAASAAVELRVPKVESAERLDHLAALAPGLPLTALVESALGVENAFSITAHPAVTRLALGESDLASELGTRSPSVLDYARIRLLYAARSAALGAPMMSAFPDIRDLDALRADTLRGRESGWFGRTAIHPSQIPVIHAAFAPSEAELRWAREVLEVGGGGGVATLSNGEMVDQAMLGRARGILSTFHAPRGATQ
jgi:citrate lyase subunit beta/citryl-CoA lyase